MGFLKKVRRVSKKIFPLGVSAAIVVAMIIPQAFAASTTTSDATSPNANTTPISTTGQSENTKVILPPPTRREKVQFYDANNKVISEQWVVNNDRIANIGEPPTIPDKTFAFWALDDGSNGWQAKPYDFNQKVTLNERNQDGVFEDSSQVLKLYPQYKEKITINFILLKDQVKQAKDKVYYSFNERLSDCTSHDTDEVQPLDTTRGCTFGDYEKDVRPFLPAGEYVAGWTTVRADAVAKNEQSKEHNDYNIRSSKNYYAIIKKGYVVSFESNGGNIVPSATTSVNQPVKKPKNPTKRGYVFKEWSTSPTEDISYNFDTPVNQNIKLYAVWDKGDSSYIVELLVEDTVDDKGNPLPLYYNVYNVQGTFLRNSLNTSNPQDVVTAANTQRKGTYHLQEISTVTTKPNGQHYKTGDKVDPSTVCAPFTREYSGFTIVPPKHPVQTDEDEDSQVDKGLNPDGSTEFICRAERPRGALVTKLSTGYEDPTRPSINPFEVPLTDALYIVYYGLLSQVGNYNGENLNTVFKKSEEILSKDQAVQEKKKQFHLGDTMHWYQDTDIPQASNTEAKSPGQDYGTFSTVDGHVYYSVPPYFSTEPGTATPPIQAHLVEGKTALVSLYREVDSSTIVSKTTNWYSYYDQRNNALQPSNYFEHVKNVIGLSNSDNAKEPEQEVSLPPSAQAKDDSVRPLNIVEDRVSDYFTRVDHIAIPGFKRIFYSYPDQPTTPTSDYYRLGNKEYRLGGTYKFLSPAKIPTYIRDKSKDAQNYYKVSIFPYKRLSYNMYFETFDGHKDYHLWVPYNYSIKETVEKKWTQEDVPHAIDEINGLKDYMKKYVPNVTRRADGAVFKGWCYSLDCKPSEVMNTDQLFEKTRMPYYDMYIVAIWNNYKRRLRVFNNAKDYSMFYTQAYANGHLITEPDYTAKALVPPLQAQTSKDLLGWLWRPRYIIGRNEDGTKRYRNGSWRVYNKNKSVEMYFDVDMRPLWRVETLKVTYLPGQTDNSGNPTGPQGTGAVEQPYVYSVLTSAVVQKNAFTAPTGYVFGGWTDEKGNVLHANDNVQMYYNRVLKALWIPMQPPVGLTYNSNYPKDLHKENKTQTVGYTNGHPTLENNTRTTVEDVPQGWTPAGYMFDGWQDTPDNDGAIQFTVGTNSVVLNNRHQNVLYARWKKNTHTVIYVHKVRYENPNVFSGKIVDLPGASFELYAKNDFGQYFPTGKDGNIVKAEVVADSYCAAKTSSAAPSSSATSSTVAKNSTHESNTEDTTLGACFSVSLDPSAYHTYALSESEAPEGYEKLAVPILFTVDANTGNVVLQESEHNVPQVTVQGGNVIQVVDIPRQPLPLSGGKGIYVWIGLSVAFILAAMGVLFAARKKE